MKERITEIASKTEMIAYANEEQDFKKFTTPEGFKCFIRRFKPKASSHKAHLCGYLTLPKEHPLSFDNIKELVDPGGYWAKHDNLERVLVDSRVHGGITFGEVDEEGNSIYGFDCIQSCDRSPLFSSYEDGFDSREYVDWRGGIATYKTMNYVEDELLELSRYIKAWEEENNYEVLRFVKYPSITNIRREKDVARLLSEVPPETQFTVTEKLHGANFSVWFVHTVSPVIIPAGLVTRIVGDYTVVFGKRTGFLKEGESFFNWQSWLDSEEGDRVLKRLEVVAYSFKRFGHLANVAFFGELFGGKINSDGIEYGELKFKVFDEYVEGEFYPTDDPYVAVQPIFRGTLTECLAYNPDERRSEHASEESVRGVEGHILRTVGGSRIKYGNIVLKHKAKWFEDVENRRVKKVKQPKAPIALTDEKQKLLDTLLKGVTEGRVKSVVSQTGIELEFKNFGKLQGRVWEDLKTEHSCTLHKRCGMVSQVRTNINHLLREMIQKEADSYSKLDTPHEADRKEYESIPTSKVSGKLICN
jgi:Rnl2 family RNA ligase